MDTDNEGSDYKATRVTDCMPKYKYKNNCNVRYLKCLQISATSRFTGYSSSGFGATPFENTTLQTVQCGQWEETDWLVSYLTQR